MCEITLLCFFCQICEDSLLFNGEVEIVERKGFVVRNRHCIMATCVSQEFDYPKKDESLFFIYFYSCYSATVECLHGDTSAMA